MPIRLDRRAPDFTERFRAFLAAKREASADVETVVRGIIADVAARGDRALIELSRKLDRVDLNQTGLRVGVDEIDAAYAACDRRALDALALARDRIEAYPAASSRPTSASPIRSGSSLGRAGARSRRSASMCPGAPPPIHPRC